jgi:hypothetical protein
MKKFVEKVCRLNFFTYLCTAVGKQQFADVAQLARAADL